LSARRQRSRGSTPQPPTRIPPAGPAKALYIDRRFSTPKNHTPRRRLTDPLRPRASPRGDNAGGRVRVGDVAWWRSGLVVRPEWSLETIRPGCSGRVSIETIAGSRLARSPDATAEPHVRSFRQRA
jgi:hypothetical protein